MLAHGPDLLEHVPVEEARGQEGEHASPVPPFMGRSQFDSREDW